MIGIDRHPAKHRTAPVARDDAERRSARAAHYLQTEFHQSVSAASAVRIKARSTTHLWVSIKTTRPRGREFLRRTCSCETMMRGSNTIVQSSHTSNNSSMTKGTSRASVKPKLDRAPVSSRERILRAAKALLAERGYEGASMSAISRAAGTSESQLIKHFTSKEGLLEAILEDAWRQVNPAIALATESVSSPPEKLRILADMMLNFLAKDEQLSTLFLLEGRRIRAGGKRVMVVPGFREFVKTIDSILAGLAKQGKIKEDVKLQAIRSALIGAVEGMLRDRLLARSSQFPADFPDSDIRKVFLAFLTAILT